MERALALVKVTQVAARVHAASPFDDVEVSNTADYFRGEAMNWARDSSNRTTSNAKPRDKSSHELWYGESPEDSGHIIVAVTVLPPEADEKNDSQGAVCSLLGPAPNRPRGTKRSLDEQSRAVIN